MTLITRALRAAPLLGLATLAALGLTARPAQAQTLLTDTTVGNYTFTVPTGVTSLYVQLFGAGGGGFARSGGAGASVSGDLFVTPGEQLTLLVGGGGDFAGGFGGGGNGDSGFGGGGGGRSAIQSGTAQSGFTELVDAGGDGGSLRGGSGVPLRGGGGGGGGSGFGGGGGGGGSSFTTGTLFTNALVTDGGAGNGGIGTSGGSGEIILTNASPVPEASSTVSLGLLLALGGVGLVVSTRRKKANG